MDANGLRQKDLADDLSGESIVSLILKEERQLNRQQMEKLVQEELGEGGSFGPSRSDSYARYANYAGYNRAVQ